MRGWKRRLEFGVGDLDDDIGTSETGRQGLEGIVEDMEVGTEELEALTGYLKTGIEDLGVFEVRVD